MLENTKRSYERVSCLITFFFLCGENLLTKKWQAEDGIRKRNKERERETDRQTDRQRNRDRDTETQTDRQRQRQKEADRER